MGDNTRHGWLTPNGQFFPSEPTPAVRMRGLDLSGHERAALDYLDRHHPDLCELLDAERVAGGYETWEDTDGTGMILNFMVRHGFQRLAADE